MTATLYYAHDPMCSWCWAFRPTWLALRDGLPDDINAQRVLGGLAPDSQVPMPENMRSMLQSTWHRIEQTVPGTHFNHAFWSENTPRRSTYPACRAVIAARAQDPAHESRMIEAIQRAYYEQARNPSDDDVLTDLAGQIGCDATRFATELNADSTQQQLQTEIQFAQALGAQGFPNLVLKDARGRHIRIPVDYHDARTTLAQIEQSRAA